MTSSFRSKVDKVKNKVKTFKERVVAKVKNTNIVTKTKDKIQSKKDAFKSKMTEWKGKLAGKFQSSKVICRIKKRSIDPDDYLPKLLNNVIRVNDSLDDFIRVVESLLEISNLVRNSKNVSELFDKCNNNSVEGASSCMERLDSAHAELKTNGIASGLTTIQEIVSVCKWNFIKKDDADR